LQNLNKKKEAWVDIIHLAKINSSSSNNSNKMNNKNSNKNNKII
jgi:hypothetical protein